MKWWRETGYILGPTKMSTVLGKNCAGTKGYCIQSQDIFPIVELHTAIGLWPWLSNISISKHDIYKQKVLSQYILGIILTNWIKSNKKDIFFTKTKYFCLWYILEKYLTFCPLFYLLIEEASDLKTGPNFSVTNFSVTCALFFYIIFQLILKGKIKFFLNLLWSLVVYFSG